MNIKVTYWDLIKVAALVVLVVNAAIHGRLTFNHKGV